MIFSSLKCVFRELVSLTYFHRITVTARPVILTYIKYPC